VPQRKNLVFRADDAGAHLAVAVLGPHGRKQGNAHEILVPADIVSTFHPSTTFPVMGCAALPVDSDFAQILPLLYCPPQPGARVIRWENAKKPGGTRPPQSPGPSGGCRARAWRRYLQRVASPPRRWRSALFFKRTLRT